jgi:hypothetical protein
MSPHDLQEDYRVKPMTLSSSLSYLNILRTFTVTVFPKDSYT